MNHKGMDTSKPKLCHLYYQYFGSLLYREAAAAQDLGFEVDIICLSHSAAEKRVKQFEGITIYQIQTRESAEKNTALYFLRLGLFFLNALLTLTYLHLVKRYKVIHVTSPPDVMVFAAVIPKLLGARVILDIHDIGPELFMRKLDVPEDRLVIRIIKKLEKISAGFADHVITVTDIWRDKLIGRSVAPEKCSVLLNVPDNGSFRPVAHSQPDGQGNDFKLFYHGSLEEHFGVDTMIEAMPLIQAQIPQVMLHIYGGSKGRLSTTLRQRSQELGMQAHVIFHDYVQFHELPGILKEAHVGIVPTKGAVFSDEAVSMKSMEYITLDIPIVISRTKAHSRYYEDSMVNFFEPEDPRDLARAVLDLYHSPARREEQVRNSRQFVSQYGWKEQSKKNYTDVIEGLVAEKT